MLLSRRCFALAVSSLAAAAGSGLLLASACKIEPSEGSDRQQVLRDLVANVIVPTYADLATTSAALALRVAELRSPTPSALDAAQQAYRAARTPAKIGEAFYFGPIDDLALTGGAIDAWPVDAPKLEQLIGGSEPLDVAQLTRLGANQRGFAALEYLLFDTGRGAGAAPDNEAVLAALRSTPRRAQLAQSVAEELAANCRKVADAFGGPEGYGKQLAEAGVDSDLFPTQAEGVDKVVTGLLYVAELMLMRKLAPLLGVDTGGALQPALEEAWRSDRSLDDLRDNLVGMRAIYSGTLEGRSGQGLGVPTRAKNAGLAARFEAALDDAQAKIAAVPPPLRVALLQNRPAVEAAYQAVRTLKNAVRVELSGALGASLGFGLSDTD